MILTTWNVWAMPFDSIQLFSRTHRWGKWTAEKLAQCESKGNELVVCCFQEAWAFRSGILAWPFLYLCSLVEECCPACWKYFSLFSQILALLTCSCCLGPCVLWDPKKWITNELKKFQVNHAVGLNGVSLRSCPPSLIDSGLLICANQKPTQSGFVGFTIYGRLESAANKGVLWAFFSSSSTLVVNTHLTGGAPKGTDQKQLWQLYDTVEKLRRKYNPDHCLICGDFNYSHLHEDMAILMREYDHISSIDRATCDGYTPKREEKVLDHVFYKGPWKEWISACDLPSCEELTCDMSDHTILVVKTDETLG